MRDWTIRISAAVSLSLFILISFANAGSGGQNNKAQPIYREFKPLSENVLQEARAARDAADMKLQRCKDLYLNPTPEDFAQMARDPNWMKVKPKTEQEIKDYNEVISDYRNIIMRYEGTEIAAYSQHNISAAYQFQGNYDEAIKQAKMGSEMFAGTSYETRFYTTIGLIYLQGIHDPNKAIGWFEKIPDPGSGGEGFNSLQNNRSVSAYISAQQSIVKCEIELGRVRKAVRRVEGLSARFPNQKENLERSMRMQMDTELQKRFRIDNRNRMEYVLKSPEFLAEAIDRLDTENENQNMH